MSVLANALALDPEDMGRLLDRLTCYNHDFGEWERDIEDDDDSEPTESRACKECGYVQVRRT